MPRATRRVAWRGAACRATRRTVRFAVPFSAAARPLKGEAATSSRPAIPPSSFSFLTP